jgi:hypothetical protein
MESLPYSLVWSRVRGYDPEVELTVAYRPRDGENPAMYLNLVGQEALQADQKMEAKLETVMPVGVPNLEVAPRLDQVNRLLVSGQSGAGKSHFASQWIKSFDSWVREPYELFIFSRVQADEQLDALPNMKRVPLNDLVGNPVTVEDLENSIVLFDDIDTIADKAVRKAVQSLRDDVLETGRHKGVQTISINHMLLAGHETKKALGEATAAVLFPRSGSKHHMNRYLRDYCGFERATALKIMALPSRWVYISRTYPPYVVHERGAFLV